MSLPERNAPSAGPRFLIIDDNSDDRALVRYQLARHFDDATFIEVHDEKTFQVALAEGDFDLVVTDYHLCWTDGLVTLKALKSRYPEVPVVMFTGTGNEEVAVAGMKGGLEDYVLKSSRETTRLAAAVELALRSAQHRRELALAESRYSQLFQSVPVGLFLATPTGQLVDVNPALSQMLAFRTREDLLRTPFQKLFARPQDFEKLRSALEREGSVRHFEVLLRCVDHNLCWADCHATIVRDPKTQAVHYEGSLEDITERKKMEAAREHHISHLEQALSSTRNLSGLLPICSSCKKIRDEEGDWNQLEVYIQKHSEAQFTHSFCPECARSLYPEIFAEERKQA
ncbi:MAG TPA: response regulator [Methylomirabilota bacterium]|nr:response regulator [Methylomirabilota bacterium]